MSSDVLVAQGRESLRRSGEVVLVASDRSAMLPTGGVFAPIRREPGRVDLGPPLVQRLVDLEPEPAVALALTERVLQDLEVLHRQGGVHGAIDLDGWGFDDANYFRVRPVFRGDQELTQLADIRAVAASLMGLVTQESLEFAGFLQVSIWLQSIGSARMGDARSVRQGLVALMGRRPFQPAVQDFLTRTGGILPPTVRSFDVVPLIAPKVDQRLHERERANSDARLWLEGERQKVVAEREKRRAALLSRPDLQSWYAEQQKQADQARFLREQQVAAAESERRKRMEKRRAEEQLRREATVVEAVVDEDGGPDRPFVVVQSPVTIQLEAAPPLPSEGPRPTPELRDEMEHGPVRVAVRNRMAADEPLVAGASPAPSDEPEELAVLGIQPLEDQKPRMILERRASFPPQEPPPLIAMESSDEEPKEGEQFSVESRMDVEPPDGPAMVKIPMSARVSIPVMLGEEAGTSVSVDEPAPLEMAQETEPVRSAVSIEEPVTTVESVTTAESVTTSELVAAPEAAIVELPVIPTTERVEPSAGEERAEVVPEVPVSDVIVVPTPGTEDTAVAEVAPVVTEVVVSSPEVPERVTRMMGEEVRIGPMLAVVTPFEETPDPTAEDISMVASVVIPAAPPTPVLVSEVHPREEDLEERTDPMMKRLEQEQKDEGYRTEIAIREADRKESERLFAASLEQAENQRREEQRKREERAEQLRKERQREEVIEAAGRARAEELRRQQDVKNQATKKSVEKNPNEEDNRDAAEAPKRSAGPVLAGKWAQTRSSKVLDLPPPLRSQEEENDEEIPSLSDSRPPQNWEGVGGVTGKGDRAAEKGPGKWTQHGRDLQELQASLPPGESRPLNITASRSPNWIVGAVGVVILGMMVVVGCWALLGV